MKNSDIAALIVIASISVLIAYFVADAVIGKPSAGSEKVDTTKEISPEVKQPNSAIFNKDAINPTVEVVIGEQ